MTKEVQLILAIIKDLSESLVIREGVSKGLIELYVGFETKTSIYDGEEMKEVYPCIRITPKNQ